MAPLRVAHDLTDRQRQILQVVAGERERQFASIRAQIDTAGKIVHCAMISFI
jgi:hypothetical protein